MWASGSGGSWQVGGLSRGSFLRRGGALELVQRGKEPLAEFGEKGRRDRDLGEAGEDVVIAAVLIRLELGNLAEDGAVLLENLAERLAVPRPAFGYASANTDPNRYTLAGSLERGTCALAAPAVPPPREPLITACILCEPVGALRRRPAPAPSSPTDPPDRQGGPPAAPVSRGSAPGPPHPGCRPPAGAAPSRPPGTGDRRCVPTAPDTHRRTHGRTDVRHRGFHPVAVVDVREDNAARRLVERTTLAQGLPVTIADVDVIRRVALLAGRREDRRGRSERRAGVTLSTGRRRYG